MLVRLFSGAEHGVETMATKSMVKSNATDKPEGNYEKLRGSSPSQTLAHDGERFVLQSDFGETHVDESVVAKIAGLAVREVPGVHSLAPFDVGQRLTNLARSATGDDYRALGVHVRVGTVETAVDVRIVANYGVSIPSLAHQIRQSVVRRVEQGTGLTVKAVNIDITDLHFEELVKPIPEPDEVELR